MNNVSLGKIVVVIGGALAFLFSFLPWWTVSFGGNSSAWSNGLFGVATWVPFFGVVAALLVALPAFANVKLPEKVLDFTIDQLVMVCGLFCTLLTIGYVVGVPDHLGMGIGLIFCFLSSAAILAGSVMDKLGIGAKPAGEQPGMTAQGYSVAQGYGQPGQQPPPPAQQAPQAPPPGQAPPAPNFAPPQQAPQGPPPGWQPPAAPPPETQLPPSTGSF